MGVYPAYPINDDVEWGDQILASHFFREEKRILQKRFSSLTDAYINASGAASDMVLVPKESKAYLEAKKIFDEAMAYIKIFKGR